ncbi:hypothetical protein GCM10027073_72410 [Streptomyces chlorus]
MRGGTCGWFAGTLPFGCVRRYRLAIAYKPGGLMDLTDVSKAVEDGNGYAAISVKTLRNAFGAQRAKSNVVQQISAGLRAGGFGHVPFDIPKRQDRTVLVYRLDGTSASALLALVEAAHGDGEQANGSAWLLSTMLPAINDKK